LEADDALSVLASAAAPDDGDADADADAAAGALFQKSSYRDLGGGAAVHAAGSKAGSTFALYQNFFFFQIIADSSLDASISSPLRYDCHFCTHHDTHHNTHHNTPHNTSA
jgi:hypothetical protein